MSSRRRLFIARAAVPVKASVLPLFLMLGGCSDESSGDGAVGDGAETGGAAEQPSGAGASGGSGGAPPGNSPAAGGELPFEQGAGGSRPVDRLTCSCPEGEYFVELFLEGETRRFTLAPPDETFPSSWSCESSAEPSFYKGGSCLPNIVSACHLDGDCITVEDRELIWTDPEGVVKLQIEPQDSDVERFLSVRDAASDTNGLSGYAVTGSILVQAEDTNLTTMGGASGASPITGSFSACAIGLDICLK